MLDPIEYADLVRRQLSLLGENPEREGLVATPGRVARAMEELTAGYGQDPKAILATTFNEPCRGGWVTVGPIPFWSLCEHHMLPFEGEVWVAYRPNQCVVGLSKVPRLVECFARRLQVQERMTEQIADAMKDNLLPYDVGVRVVARHSCMRMRGARCNGTMTTVAWRGLVERRPDLRVEVLSLFNSAGP